jgi:hypothetical protein
MSSENRSIRDMVRRKALILLDVDRVLNPRMAERALALDHGRSLVVTELAKLGTIAWATSWDAHYTAGFGRRSGGPASLRASPQIYGCRKPVFFCLA